VDGVVAERERPLGGRPRHDVEVVHRVAGSGDARTVIAVRDEHDVVVAHLDQFVESAEASRLMLGSRVAAVVAETGAGRAHLVVAGDPVVVDLFVDYGARLARIVLVAVARPVAGRCDQLAADELFGVVPHTRHQSW